MRVGVMELGKGQRDCLFVYGRWSGQLPDQSRAVASIVKDLEPQRSLVAPKANAKLRIPPGRRRADSHTMHTPFVTREMHA